MQRLFGDAGSRPPPCRRVVAHAHGGRTGHLIWRWNVVANRSFKLPGSTSGVCHSGRGGSLADQRAARGGMGCQASHLQALSPSDLHSHQAPHSARLGRPPGTAPHPPTRPSTAAPWAADKHVQLRTRCAQEGRQRPRGWPPAHLPPPPLPPSAAAARRVHSALSSRLAVPT